MLRAGVHGAAGAVRVAVVPDLLQQPLPLRARLPRHRRPPAGALTPSFQPNILLRKVPSLPSAPPVAASCASPVFACTEQHPFPAMELQRCFACLLACSYTAPLLHRTQLEETLLPALLALRRSSARTCCCAWRSRWSPSARPTCCSWPTLRTSSPSSRWSPCAGRRSACARCGIAPLVRLLRVLQRPPALRDCCVCARYGVPFWLASTLLRPPASRQCSVASNAGSSPAVRIDFDCEGAQCGHRRRRRRRRHDCGRAAGPRRGLPGVAVPVGRLVMSLLAPLRSPTMMAFDACYSLVHVLPAPDVASFARMRNLNLLPRHLSGL